MKKPGPKTELFHLESGNVLLSRAFPPALFFRHWRRAGGNLTKYNVARWVGTTRKSNISPVQAQKENPDSCLGFLFVESGNVLLSRAVSSQVPSALKGLTSVFGMGTGGSLSPLSPECCQGSVQSFVFLVSDLSFCNQIFLLGDSPHMRSCYAALTLKTAHPDFLPSCNQPANFPFGLSQFLDQVLDRLVSPSSIRYRTSTGDLSPGSLPGVLLLSNGTLLLEVGFTLRCLQRLSAPHFASQLCRWHDNCCTSDASTPVLSY